MKASGTATTHNCPGTVTPRIATSLRARCCLSIKLAASLRDLFASEDQCPWSRGSGDPSEFSSNRFFKRGCVRSQTLMLPAPVGELVTDFVTLLLTLPTTTARPALSMVRLHPGSHSWLSFIAITSGHQIFISFDPRILSSKNARNRYSEVGKDTECSGRTENTLAFAGCIAKKRRTRYC